jgi:hypothetical protein
MLVNAMHTLQRKNLKWRLLDTLPRVPVLHAVQAPCMGREMLYAAGYLGLCPVLYDRLKGAEVLKVSGQPPKQMKPGWKGSATDAGP